MNHGGPVNEIDIAEVYGLSAITNTLPHATYNTHAWGPNHSTPVNNPYNLPNDAEIGSRNYPNQNWWNYLPTYYLFNQADWHIYTCEWDTAKIAFYVDGSHVNTIWKYYQYRYMPGPRRHSVHDPVYHYKVYPTCNPISGVWQITYGYPYSNNSECNIRISTGMLPGVTGNPAGGTYEIGRTEVDYVKAWQKHPEQDGHTNLCSQVQTPVVTGPIQMCSSATYVATPAIPGGYWTTSTGASVGNNGVNGSGDAFAVIYRNANSPWNVAAGSVTYNYPGGAEGCPVGHTSKLFNCFAQESHTFFVVHTLEAGYGQFQLFAPGNELAPDLAPTFEWNVAYVAGTETDTQHYHASGRFISSPIYQQDSTNQNYYLHWDVTAKGSDGYTITKSGYRTAQSQYGHQSDTSIYYLDAQIADSSTYEQSVYDAVGQTFMAPDADSFDILQMIEKIRAQKLAPYIVPIGTPQSRPSGNQNANGLILSEPTKVGAVNTRIYPNPVDNTLNIFPGHHFEPNSYIVVKLYNVVGSLQKEIKKMYIAGEGLRISLSGLNSGTYLVELEQNGHIEHYKIIKK